MAIKCKLHLLKENGAGPEVLDIGVAVHMGLECMISHAAQCICMVHNIYRDLECTMCTYVRNYPKMAAGEESTSSLELELKFGGTTHASDVYERRTLILCYILHLYTSDIALHCVVIKWPFSPSSRILVS